MEKQIVLRKEKEEDIIVSLQKGGHLSKLLVDKCKDDAKRQIMAAQIIEIHKATGIPGVSLLKGCYEIQGKLAIESEIVIQIFNKQKDKLGLDFIEYNRGEDEQRGYWSQAKVQNLKTGKYYTGQKCYVKDYAKESIPWKKFPKVMIDYRAAVYLIRNTFPGILFGSYTQDEIMEESIPIPVKREITDPIPKAAPKKTLPPTPSIAGTEKDMEASKQRLQEAQQTPQASQEDTSHKNTGSQESPAGRAKKEAKQEGMHMPQAWEKEQKEKT